MGSKPLHLMLLVLAGFLALGGFFQDLKNTENGGAIDLRNRVTGARAGALGFDPFIYKWKMPQPETLCDPYNATSWPVSKTTVTPVLLTFFKFFNGVNYKSMQWLWLIVQYGALVLGLIAWTRGQPGATLRLGLILTLLFCATPAWRLHVDRGQSYILYTSLFFLFAWLGRKPRKLGGQVLEGFTGSLLMGLRPIFFGQFALPWDRRRWTTLVAGIAGAALLAILPVLAFGPSIWSQYHKGMEEHARLYLEQAEQSNEATAFPGKVEGIPFDQLSRFADIPFGDTSLYKLVSFDLPSKPLLVLWALLMFGSGFWLLHRCPGQPTLLAWAVAAWANIGDFLLPAFRNIYNDVLFLPLLLLGLAVLKEGKPRTWWLMSCLVFVLSHLTLRFVPKGFIPIPSVIGLIMAIGAIGWTFYVARQATPDEKGKSSDPPGNLTKA